MIKDIVVVLAGVCVTFYTGYAAFTKGADSLVQVNDAQFIVALTYGAVSVFSLLATGAYVYFKTR